jgi:hypothetical protein
MYVEMRRPLLFVLSGLIPSAIITTIFFTNLPSPPPKPVTDLPYPPPKPVQSVERIVTPRTWQAPMPLPTAVVQSGRRMPLLPTTDADDRSSTVELRGQVTMSTSFGRELHRLAQLPEVRLVLEIGTWYGGGSSWCIAQGLTEGKWLITMEMFEEAWRYASETLRNMPVTCMRAGTVGVEHYLKPEQMTPEDRASEHYKLYYDRDLALARTATPMLSALCNAYDFDLVLIDGNEYTGLAEFEIVDRECRPRYLALHDTGTLKTRRVEEILSNHSLWRKISSGTDAAGWAVYSAASPCLVPMSVACWEQRLDMSHTSSPATKAF